MYMRSPVRSPVTSYDIIRVQYVVMGRASAMAWLKIGQSVPSKIETTVSLVIVMVKIQTREWLQQYKTERHSTEPKWLPSGNLT